MTKELDIIWGAFFGMILGLIVSKVYETWAYIYKDKGIHHAYMNGLFSTPLWVRATELPTVFTVIVILLFTIIGIIFVKYLQKRERN